MKIRQIRKMWDDDKKINDNCYFDLPENNDLCADLAKVEKNTHKLFNKMIILLKNTSRHMTSIIEDSEEDWIIYNTFMQHKKVIDYQIDILIKEKKKIKVILT